ncbi:hypothetical protein [Clostridium akagii]|uniref:hypothetical protein n=1 Tax=Clostridium akagii TaxID=91623 RepID=UPI00047CC0A1|nr:hypothetical protein [Clostridium akagii]
MEGLMKPIGGEFWFDDIFLDNTINNMKNSNGILLSGGQSAIQFIIENINFKQDEYILIPSYLCPTILYNFQRKKINILFYEINEDLSINLMDIENKINQYKIKALFFIDYFGFYHDNNTIQFLKSIKENGIILIEDAVQMFWFKRMKKFIGDYVFNSYRKFLPVDGSVVLCNNNGEFEFDEDDYCKLMNEARLKKTQYIKFNIGKEQEFLNLFNEAEEAYYKRKNVNGMDNESKKLLNKTNYELIKKTRFDNYTYLYDRLKEVSGIKILFNKELIEDNIPLGLPILINNRDFIRKELRNYSIYCPIHWDISNEAFIKEFDKSLYVSNNLLTLPIDNRNNEEDMERLLSEIMKLVGGEVL